MKLAPDVIFYCNMIIIASENASSKREMLSMVNKELKKWKITTSRALECIDEYVEHLSEIMKEHDSFSKKNPTDPIYQRYKVERSILLEIRPLLSPK
jgi:Ribonuclease G/E